MLCTVHIIDRIYCMCGVYEYRDYLIDQMSEQALKDQVVLFDILMHYILCHTSKANTLHTYLLSIYIMKKRMFIFS